MNIENMFDKPDVKQLVHAFSLLDDENDIQAFLTDICTPREICDLSQRLQVARYLVQGCDVWLNTPTRPLEASGTSGEKCVMNGVLQFSVLDGWWVEGYKEGAGWALPMETVFSDPQYQN